MQMRCADKEEQMRLLQDVDQLQEQVTEKRLTSASMPAEMRNVTSVIS